MRRLLWVFLVLLGTFITTIHADTKGLEVSFGVTNTAFIDNNKSIYNLYVNEPLGFDCTLENEIILKFGDILYKYDENEKTCISDDKTGISILTWYSDEINLHSGIFTVDVREVDIASDDLYVGNKVTLTSDDIVNIQRGEYIQKDIGSNYFIGLKGIVINPNITIQNFSTDGIVTFESFYKDSSSVGWGTVALVTVVIVAATTVTVLSGGTAAPALAGLASSIPGVASVAGAAGAAGTVGGAATASGLAAIGSAVGGGMAAGLIIVGSGLAVGTEIAVDYTFSKVINEYSYSNFAKDSTGMLTLPLPKNTNGCNGYEDAMDIIKDIDSEKPISSNEVQEMIIKAIKRLDDISDDIYSDSKRIVGEMGVSDAWNNPERFNKANDIVNKYEDTRDLDGNEKARKDTLLALLYFMTNNYEKAKKHAETSISLAKKENIKHTLPSFINATSSLYDKSLDYEKIIANLRYSLLNEPDNPIIPLMLSIHLDRVMYRFDDVNVGEESLSKTFEITTHKSLEALRLQNYIIVLSRYLLRLKIEQQKISSLATVNNQTIKNSPKTLYAIKKSLENYKSLISGANKILKGLEVVKIDDEKTAEVEEQIKTYKQLVGQYENDKTRLQGLIQDLEEYQASLVKKEVEEVEEIKEKEVVKEDKNIYLYIGLSIVFLVLIILFIVRRKKQLIFDRLGNEENK